MARRIVPALCINCGACMTECPNGGIEEVEGVYAVTVGYCTECYGFAPQPRCVAVCPTGAIETDTDDAPPLELIADRAADLHADAFPRS